MKITQIRAFPMKPKAPPPKGDRGRDYWGTHTEVAGPMSRYPRFKRHRSLWRPTWPDIGCVAIAEDGTPVAGLMPGPWLAPGDVYDGAIGAELRVEIEIALRLARDVPIRPAQ